MPLSRACVLGAGLVVLLPVAARSQDAHYWTNQYGTRSELVGGLVVGRSLDLSSTYYNPGGLAFVRDPGLLFTTNAWELQSFDFEDIAVDDLDLGTTRIRLPPGMFALQLPFSTSRHRFAISAVTRFSSSIEASATRIPTAEEVAGAPGSVASALEASGTFRLNEGWLGPTWAFRAGSKVGVGVSGYMAVRSQSGRSQTIQQIATPQNTGLTNVDVTEFSYWNVRLLSKLGVEVDLSPFTFGVTFTTPSVDIVGKGEVLVNKGTTAISPLDSTFVTDVSATSQKDLTSAYKSAPAVALGASYSVGATTFYGTAEWNGGIGEYAILNASDYVGQTSGDTLSVDVNYELKPVLNWGLGLERQFRDWFHFYGAFFVDRSALPEDNDDVVTVALAQWDILHVTGGFAFSVGRVDLTLGLSYGWGSEEIRKPFTVPGESPTAQLNYQSLKLILGFAAAF